MSERLIIRLGSQQDQPVYWLVWSDGDGEIIASGTLGSAHELDSLSERAGGRDVEVLVPGSDVVFTEVTLPKKNRSQALKGLPYMLEDDLATDVDLMHFTLGAAEGEQQPVVVVEKQQVRQWLNWLKQADLVVSRMIPDLLALPWQSGSCSLLQLGEQVLIRQTQCQGMTVDKEWLAPVLAGLKADDAEITTVMDFGHQPIGPIEGIEWQPQPLELPLQTLASGVVSAPVDLLHGEFSQRKASKGRWQIWHKVAVLGGLALLLVFGQRLLEIRQLEARQAQLKASSEAIYRQLFPAKKRIIRLKPNIQKHLQELSGGRNDKDLLTMLGGLREAFEKVPKLKPVTLKFNAARQEISIQADADSFEQFEQFKSLVDKNYLVENRAMNNKGGRVNGSMIIKVSS